MGFNYNDKVTALFFLEKFGLESVKLVKTAWIFVFHDRTTEHIRAINAR